MSQFCKNYKRPVSQFTVGNKNFGNKDWKNYFLSFPDLKIDFHGLKKKKIKILLSPSLILSQFVIHYF